MNARLKNEIVQVLAEEQTATTTRITHKSAIALEKNFITSSFRDAVLDCLTELMCEKIIILSDDRFKLAKVYKCV